LELNILFAFPPLVQRLSEQIQVREGQLQQLKRESNAGREDLLHQVEDLKAVCPQSLPGIVLLTYRKSQQTMEAQEVSADAKRMRHEDELASLSANAEARVNAARQEAIDARAQLRSLQVS
jgi:hypothetical protein